MPAWPARPKGRAMYEVIVVAVVVLAVGGYLAYVVWRPERF
jgi:hypothetical protein